jgi:hypothetical protein
LVDSLQQDLKTENPCSAVEKESEMTPFPPPGIELPLKSGRSRRLCARSRLTRE